MVRLINLLVLLSFFVCKNLFSNNLNKDEELYFNFADLNNDNLISILEIEQSIKIVFQLVDFNQDGYISKSEISELKNIFNSLK